MNNVHPLAAQLSTMFALQDQLNQRVSNTWRTDNFAWYRAMWTESAELMEHYGWKWWKKQSPDAEQVKLELVDIWHFGLSDMLQQAEARGESLSTLIERTQAGLSLPRQYTDFRDALEAFTKNVLTTKKFDLFSFADMLAIVGISPEQLYASYIGKNVLNFFRQDHGYKDGSYIKNWNGREDNIVAFEIANEWGADEELFEQLYLDLETYYKEEVLKQEVKTLDFDKPDFFKCNVVN